MGAGVVNRVMGGRTTKEYGGRVRAQQMVLVVNRLPGCNRNGTQKAYKRKKHTESSKRVRRRKRKRKVSCTHDSSANNRDILVQERVDPSRW